MKLILRVIGLIAGSVVGWKVYLLMLTEAPQSTIDLTVAIASVGMGILIRILNYFLTDDEDIGVTEFVLSFITGMIAGFFVYKIIPIFTELYNWVFG